IRLHHRRPHHLRLLLPRVHQPRPPLSITPPPRLAPHPSLPRPAADLPLPPAPPQTPPRRPLPPLRLRPPRLAAELRLPRVRRPHRPVRAAPRSQRVGKVKACSQTSVGSNSSPTRTDTIRHEPAR